LPEELVCKLDYLNQKLKFSSNFLFEKEMNFMLTTNNNIQNYLQNNLQYNNSINDKKLFYDNINILRNIFSISSLNLNHKAIPINQWIFWQYTHFNQWLTLEEEMEYMRSLIYDIYLTENYSSKEIFNLAQYLLTELVKFELLHKKEINAHITEDNYNINNESSFSKHLLKLINELISEAWNLLISKSNNNVDDHIYYLNWLNDCLSNLLKYEKRNVIIIFNKSFI